jgi:hypothetical protein
VPELAELEGVQDEENEDEKSTAPTVNTEPDPRS